MIENLVVCLIVFIYYFINFIKILFILLLIQFTIYHLSLRKINLYKIVRKKVNKIFNYLMQF